MKKNCFKIFGLSVLIGLTGITLASCGNDTKAPTDDKTSDVESNESTESKGESSTETETQTETDTQTETESETQTEGQTETEDVVVRHTVVFTCEGEADIVNQIEDGNLVTKPANPTKTGHTFLGWFVNDVAYDFNMPVKSDLTLVAKFEGNPCKYTFLNTDGSVIKEETIKYGEAIVAPEAPTMDGDNLYDMVFAGWDKEMPETITEDITFTATFNKVAKEYAYTLEFKDDKLVISGDANTKYFGKNILIDFELPGVANRLESSAKISDAGKFVVEFLLSDVELFHQGFAHITIYGETKDDVLLGGPTTNFAIDKNMTSLADKHIDGTDMSHSIEYKNADGVIYYAGNAWDGLMIYAANPDFKLSYTNVSLVQEGDKIYYVVSGSYEGFTKENIQLTFDMQHNDQIDHCGWGYPVGSTKIEGLVFDEEAKTFTARIDVLSVIGNKFNDDKKEMWGLTVHFGFYGKNSDIKDVTVSGEAIKVGNLEYSIQYNEQSFNTPALVIKNVGAPVYQSATVANVDGRAIVTITGTGSVAESFFKNLVCEYNVFYNTQGWDGDWAKHDLVSTFSIKDGVLTFTMDVTDLLGNEKGIGYTTKLRTEATEGKDPVDLKIQTAVDSSVTIGNKTYQVVGTPNSGDPNQFWGCLGVIVKEVAA